MKNHHFLLISCPAQGHINPCLQLSKCLIQSGGHVTFATTVHGLGQIKSLPSLPGLSFASFSDGFDNGTKLTDDPNHVMSQMKRVSSQSLTNLILSLSSKQHNKPITFLIYSILLPWAAAVARDLSIPSAFLCIQSATAFAIYNHYFNREQDSPHVSILPTFLEHIQTLEDDPNPCVLLNTYDVLEKEAIAAVSFMNPISIGPLIDPCPFLDEKDQSNESFSCDLFEASPNKDYLQWLDSKPNSSVVYVSFGSMVVLQAKQIIEVLLGLLNSGRPFMWPIHSSKYRGEEDEDKIAMKEIIEGVEQEKGLIIPYWCSQVEVLCHRSVGCFVAHCGWNSTVESLAAGVPVVGCPQFSDQTTNAKMVEEVWGNGVRAKGNEDGIIVKEEIKRCVDEVMSDGEKGEDIRRNATKWKGLVKEALKEGGSSSQHLKLFMERLM
ncbi:Glycosyltransferase [Quillaja saponaria]|uniref:Glycosyltransferase n=1 Tax=Quillaja saponaria TaxID=32244 RepID=A0AAD7LH37_QUISA|nr:Glycosyltransferase [Quillaja saponaria]